MEETFKSYKNLINLYNKNVWNNKREWFLVSLSRVNDLKKKKDDYHHLTVIIFATFYCRYYQTCNVYCAFLIYFSYKIKYLPLYLSLVHPEKGNYWSNNHRDKIRREVLAWRRVRS